MQQNNQTIITCADQAAGRILQSVKANRPYLLQGEWKLLDDGHVMLETDECWNPRSGQWVPIGPSHEECCMAGMPWNARSFNPVRRNLVEG